MERINIYIDQSSSPKTPKRHLELNKLESSFKKLLTAADENYGSERAAFDNALTGILTGLTALANVYEKSSDEEDHKYANVLKKLYEKIYESRNMPLYEKISKEEQKNTLIKCERA